MTHHRAHAAGICSVGFRRSPSHQVPEMIQGSAAEGTMLKGLSDCPLPPWVGAAAGGSRRAVGMLLQKALLHQAAEIRG